MEASHLAQPTKGKLALPTIFSEEKISMVTHCNGERKLDVENLLILIENVLPAAIDVQMACKAPGEVDIEKTALAILNLLSSYSCDAKLVLSLAALMLEFVDLLRILKDLTDGSSKLPREFFKSLAILKRLSGFSIHEHLELVKLNNLIKNILQVTRSIFEFEKLRMQSQSADKLSTIIPNYVYLTSTSIVACATQITILKNKEEAQDLSDWSENMMSILKDLEKRKQIYNEQTEEFISLCLYWNLFYSFQNSYAESSLQIVEILKLLIGAENDVKLLHSTDGSTVEEIKLNILWKKDVLLLISSLDILDEDIEILKSIYQGLKGFNYEIVWIPIEELWTAERQETLYKWQAHMSWYTVKKFSSIAGIKYIREQWHFKGEPIMVLMNQQGQVENLNVLPLIPKMGVAAFPHIPMTQESTEAVQSWLSLLTQSMDQNIETWISEEKYIFLYGGTDQLWIKKFEGHMKSISFGNFTNQKEGNNTNVVSLNYQENGRRFWTMIESFYSLYSVKAKQEVNSTTICETFQVLEKLISYKTASRWAMLTKGSTVLIIDHGTKILRMLKRVKKVNHFSGDNLEIIFREYYGKVINESFDHSYQVDYSSLAEDIPGSMECIVCHKNMEKFTSFRCGYNLITEHENEATNNYKDKLINGIDMINHDQRTARVIQSRDLPMM
ncbi:hypothetical protein FEM48_Zijuj07G0112700 [Ziziphus jujuba var. spinosa]|uniref:Protein SIEVE ELEMENT OCCLUSION B-like n=1 Tax=Ziziphus jujuba var. spinosa TaxID=714518 RepID=A0A978V4B3_ZIZJJ|nr:hypothetical protein FEM48_Zijuj07G0112700 [Ziziphus jujuba var. spinosa]